MIAYVVTPRFPLPEGVHHFHRLIHNGCGRRSTGAPRLYEKCEPEYIGVQSQGQLAVARSGVVVPTVFAPNGVFVMARPLALTVAQDAVVECRDVVFERLYRYWCAPGDDSYETDLKREFAALVKTQAGREQYAEEGDAMFLEGLPDDPSLHASAGRYCEIVTYDWESMVALDATAKMREVTCQHGTKITVSASVGIVERLGIVPAVDGIVLSESRGGPIVDQIDQRFFDWAVVDI